eukprot:Lankesteria_metandrocarpae@DN8527_c0_g1_i1.p1
MQRNQHQSCFSKALDRSDVGILGRLARFDGLLRRKDPAVARHLQICGVESQFYALRWLLLLFTQEFRIEDCLRLWDSMLSDRGSPLPLLYYICIAIIRKLRSRLLKADFSNCMRLLQNFPSYRVEALIDDAVSLRRADREANIKPYVNGEMVLTDINTD